MHYFSEISYSQSFANCTHLLTSISIKYFVNFLTNLSDSEWNFLFDIKMPFVASLSAAYTP